MTALADYTQALLGARDLDESLRLVDDHPLSEEQARTTVMSLYDEAQRLIGSDPIRMESIARISQAVAAKSGAPFLQATAQHSYADALRFQGRNHEAVAQFDRAAEIFNHLGHPEEAARTRVGWAWVMAALGKPEAAIKSARAARAVLLAHGLTARVAALDTTVGFIFDEHGRHRDALRHFTSAMRIYRALGDKGLTGLARAHGNRGRVLTRLGQYERANIDLQLARDMFLAQGARRDGAVSTQAIGEHQLNLGQYTAAIKNFEHARPIVRSLGLDRESMVLARYLADCYLALGRPRDAIEALDEVREALDRSDIAQMTIGLAGRRVAALLALDESEEALELLTKVAVSIPTGAIHHRALIATQKASVLLKQEQYAEAAEEARSGNHFARSAGIRRLEAEALILEASALIGLGRIEEATELAKQARNLARRVGGAPLLHRTSELQGLVAEKIGLFSRARRYYATAIQQLGLEQNGVIFEFRDSFIANRGLAYERLAVLQAAAGLAKEALATVEAAKSRALAAVMAGAIQLRPRGGVEARLLTKQLAVARQEYAAAVAGTRASSLGAGQTANQKRIDEIEGRISGLVQRLQILAAPEGIQDLYGQTVFSGTASVPKDTALIEFFFAGPDMLRFVVTASGVCAEVCRGVVPDLERQVRSLLLNLSAAERLPVEQVGRLAGQAQSLLEHLSQRLLGGVDDLSVFKSVVIVPHSFLHYLPFHALYVGDKYLIEKAAVSYVPSATVYELCQKRKRNRSRAAFVMGNSYEGMLPFTNAEADQVASMFGAHAYQDAQATREALEGAGCKASIIHIAAHGHYRKDAPMFSAIELADGPLTSADVFGLKLRANLVTLSACETGRSIAGGGDELVGLARSFLAAGAGGLLVSQWRVDDAATSRLMTRFYQEFALGNAAASALRTAQLEMIQAQMPQTGACHPFLWAGFQLIGDDRGMR